MCANCEVEDPNADAAVLRTVTWLDGFKPEWRSLMDWNRFDMWNTTRCVAGQVFAEEAKAEDAPWGVFDGYDYYLHLRNHDEVTPMAFHALDTSDSYISADEIAEAWLRWADANAS